MSMYGDYVKDCLYDEMVNFVTDKNHSVHELIEMVSDVVCHSYWATVDNRVKQIKNEYECYKTKCEQMEQILKTGIK